MKLFKDKSIDKTFSFQLGALSSKGAFSIIELLIGIFIFSMGIISVFSIIINTLNLNEYNKNYIIAANLAREQIELVRNIRDSNYEKIQIYNQINPNSDIHSDNNIFATGAYYKIENDFSSSENFPVKVTRIEDFGEGENMLSTKMINYNLCLTPDNLYTHDCKTGDERTYFYKYIKIDDVTYNENGITKTISDAFKVTSKVIWYKKGYKEFEITSIFTDFKRF